MRPLGWKNSAPKKVKPRRLVSFVSALFLGLAGLGTGQVAAQATEADEGPLPLPGMIEGGEDGGQGAGEAVDAQAGGTLCPANYQAEVLDLVNQERVAEGLDPLVANEGLAAIGEMWAGWLAAVLAFGPDSFVHLPDYYETQFPGSAERGWEFWWATGNTPGGENIARGQPTSQWVVQDWMDSPGHRANILTPNFARMGIGCVESEYGLYWAQEFSYGPATPITDYQRFPIPNVAGSLKGTAAVGATLTAEISGTLPPGTNLSYKWTANGNNIAGAANRVFTVTESEVGKQIRSVVTASNNPLFYRNTPTTLGPTAAVPGNVLKAPTPIISGTTKVGETLTVTGAAKANFTPAADSVAYQWYRDSVAISGATGTTYKLVAADAGKQMTVKVTGTKAGYQSASKTSAATPKVQQADPKPKPDPKLTVTRLSGPTRYGTNVEVNKKTAAKGKPVFVASGAAFPDALSAGPAVKKEGGSLFLTPKANMPAQTLNAIKGLNPSKIYIVGGAGAVSNTVRDQLRQATGKTPDRVSGPSRYETSQEVFKRFFPGNQPLIFVATGGDYPDALTASAVGGALNAPVLLVPGKKASAPSEVSLAKNRNAQQIQIVGGTGAVSSGIEQQFKASLGASKVKRLSGVNRYDTNLKVNEYLSKQPGVSTMTEVWLATGTNFPDALSAAVPAGEKPKRLVLSNGQCVPSPVVSSWIKGANSKVEHVYLTGGTGALGAPVFQLKQCN